MPAQIIRMAVEADATAIQQLVRQARLNPTGLNWRHFWVAVTPKNQVVGCVQIKPHRDGSQELASLVVAEPYRGQGIARVLVENLLQEHAGPLYLMCRSELGPFYMRFGFHSLTVDEMPTYFRRISRLAGLAEWMQKEGSHLLIMGIRHE